jgi:hypothetical protein
MDHGHTVQPNETVARQGPPQLNIRKVIEKTTRFVLQFLHCDLMMIKDDKAWAPFYNVRVS